MSTNHPSQYNLAKYGTHRLWIDVTEWSRDQRAWIGLAAFACRVLGPDVVFVSHESDADVSLRRWVSDENGGAIGAGLYTESKRLIQIDPVGCHGELEFRQAVAHELGHYLGCDHVSKRPAIMAETLGDAGPEKEIDFETYAGNVAPVDFTPVDLAEFNRAYAVGRYPVPRK